MYDQEAAIYINKYHICIILYFQPKIFEEIHIYPQILKNCIFNLIVFPYMSLPYPHHVTLKQLIKFIGHVKWHVPYIFSRVPMFPCRTRGDASPS